MQRRVALLAVLLLGGCGPLFCRPTPMGQYGPYLDPFKIARLVDGDTVTVYRVKYWTFTDGAPPALQVEYESPVTVSDTSALRAMGRRIWPIFVPYVEEIGLSDAIITATNRQHHGNQVANFSTMQHYGLIAHRDAGGVWRFTSDTAALPLVTHDAAAGIFERNGSRLSVR